jgi:hypothetical protein
MKQGGGYRSVTTKGRENDEFAKQMVQSVLSGPTHPVIPMKKMQDVPGMKCPAAMAGQDRANFLRGNSEVLTRGAMHIIGIAYEINLLLNYATACDKLRICVAKNNFYLRILKWISGTK